MTHDRGHDAALSPTHTRPAAHLSRCRLCNTRATVALCRAVTHHDSSLEKSYPVVCRVSCVMPLCRVSCVVCHDNVIVSCVVCRVS